MEKYAVSKDQLNDFKGEKYSNEKLKKLFEKLQPLEEVASGNIMDVEGKTAEQIGEKVINWIRAEGGVDEIKVYIERVR
jgi:hypothetical protein